jgi:3-hydroxybutyryl-CoA dehydratase
VSLAVEALAVDWTAPFDDLAEGASFTTRGRTVTEADVVAFASLTGDFHPLHTDKVWAARGPFGERIAHGLLVVGMAVGLAPLDPSRVLALRRVGEAVFKRPVRLGDTVTLSGRITDLKPAGDDAGLVTFAWTIANQDGLTVCRASVELLWRRDGAPASDDGFVPIPL